MEVYRITSGALAVNSYAVTKNGSDCVVIDCYDFDAVMRLLKEKRLTCKALLLTHAHFDHCKGAAALQREGAEVYMHEADVPLLNSTDNLAEAMGDELPHFSPDVLLKGGELLSLCGMQIKVLHTPGHTAGGVCYLIDDEYIFSGDTLFYLSVGRTDFPSGNANTLQSSIRNRLFSLTKDYKVYPGHDRETTLFFERDNNFYV